MQETPHGSGRIRLAHVPDASATGSEAVVTQAVAPGSTVRTDDWKGFGRLWALGYPRRVVRAEASVGEHLLPLADRVVSLSFPNRINAGLMARLPRDFSFFLE